MNLNDNWAKDKIAFITGATSGFGLALAHRILNAGGKVIAIGRRIERLEALANEYSGKVHICPLDMTDTAKIRECIESLPADFKNVNILFNNAGLALGLEPANEASLEDWDTMINTNIRGLVHTTRYILEGMVLRNQGDIINVGSVAGTYPYPGANVYGGTKAFVHQFSLNLRADLIGKNIRVTCIEPGMCDTEFSTVRFKGNKEAADKVYEGTKSLSADDVALTIENVLRLPPHININTIELMPVIQAFSSFAVHRS